MLGLNCNVQLSPFFYIHLDQRWMLEMILVSSSDERHLVGWFAVGLLYKQMCLRVSWCFSFSHITGLKYVKYCGLTGCLFVGLFVCSQCFWQLSQTTLGICKACCTSVASNLIINHWLLDPFATPHSDRALGERTFKTFPGKRIYIISLIGSGSAAGKHCNRAPLSGWKHSKMDQGKCSRTISIYLPYSSLQTIHLSSFLTAHQPSNDNLKYVYLSQTKPLFHFQVNP